MRPPKKETLFHKQAFEYYLSLGSDRSLSAVAEKFGYSEMAVQNWNQGFKWADRVEQRESRIAKKLEERTDKRALSTIERQLKIVEAIQARFVQKVREGKIDPTVTEFIKSAEHELLLMGHPTKREAHAFDLGAFGEAIANIIAVINRCMPQSCPGCGLHLDARQQIAQGLQMALPAPEQTSEPQDPAIEPPPPS